MTNITLSDEYLEDIEREFKNWAEFLNSVIGLLAFSLALACLGTKLPWVSASLSMVIIGFVRAGGSHIFPPEITRLREEARSDPKAQVVLAGLTKRHLSISVLMLKYPVFVIGSLLLLSVVFCPVLVWAFPLLSKFYGVA